MDYSHYDEHEYKAGGTNSWTAFVKSYLKKNKGATIAKDIKKISAKYKKGRKVRKGKKQPKKKSTKLSKMDELKLLEELYKLGPYTRNKKVVKINEKRKQIKQILRRRIKKLPKDNDVRQEIYPDNKYRWYGYGQGGCMSDDELLLEYHRLLKEKLGGGLEDVDLF